MILTKTTYEYNNIVFVDNDIVKVKIYDYYKNNNPYLGEVLYYGKIVDLTDEEFNLINDEFSITIKVNDVELIEKI